MKKITLFVMLFSCAAGLFAAEDSRIFVRPGRETFVYFPSTHLKDQYNVTFFLPEDFVPLSQNYPVVVALGLTSAQAEAVAAFQQHNPAIVVGVNFQEKDYLANEKQIYQFLTREIIPYVDTNYLTKTGPENRILAVQGPAASKIALQAAKTPQLFGALVLVSPGSTLNPQTLAPVRTLVVGSQAELAGAQRAFEQAGKTYGPDFALRYTPTEGMWLDWVQTDYLWADVAQTQIKRLKAEASERAVSLANPVDVFLRVGATLKGKWQFHYVPTDLRISPPFFTWEPAHGRLHVISGAAAGKVHVRNTVDKTPFSVKIKLKKQ